MADPKTDRDNFRKVVTDALADLRERIGKVESAQGSILEKLEKGGSVDQEKETDDDDD